MAFVGGTLFVVPLGIAALYGVGFLVAGYFRVTYPYPLEGLENASIQAVRRIVAGQPLYGPPTIEFVPPLYSPLYFYISAIVAQALGLGLPTLRLVSLLASVASAMLIAHLVWRETRSVVPAVAAGALFLGSTHLASNVLDVARTDALALFWLLAAITCARSADLRPRHAVWLSGASGALTALAILTKQTTAVLMFALVLHSLLSGNLRRPTAYLFGVGVTVGLGAIMLVAFSGGSPGFTYSSSPASMGSRLIV